MANAIGSRVNAEFANLDGVRGVCRNFRAAQKRLHASDEFARTEGLGDVIVGSHFQPDDAVSFLASSREHQDGQTVERLVAANLAADFQAGKLGKHQVEEQDIGRSFLQGSQAGHTVVS